MKILFLVLFVLFTSLSCKQNPSRILSSPPKEERTNNNTGSSNTNSGSNNDLNSGYGCYDVYILENGDSVQTVKYRISDTDKLLKVYSNMIIDSQSGKPRFELYNASSKSAVAETYTFDLNLDLNKSTAGTSTISKKFKGVCLVIIYPDAATTANSSFAATTANSSLLGCYTIAGIYTEMPDIKKNTSRAMINSTEFQNAGYDELIILRTDKPKDDTANTKNTNYRADILFNDGKWISFYNYDPDRTFEKQNTNFIFKRATTATP